MASHVKIQLITEDDLLKLIYEDDGVGIDFSLMDSQKGIGLKNIESKLSLIEGKIEYQDRSSGFHVEIQVVPSLES